jgi:hypothetical protein
MLCELQDPAEREPPAGPGARHPARILARWPLHAPGGATPARAAQRPGSRQAYLLSLLSPCLRPCFSARRVCHVLVPLAHEGLAPLTDNNRNCEDRHKMKYGSGVAQEFQSHRRPAARSAPLVGTLIWRRAHRSRRRHRRRCRRGARPELVRCRRRRPPRLLRCAGWPTHATSASTSMRTAEISHARRGLVIGKGHICCLDSAFTGYGM